MKKNMRYSEKAYDTKKIADKLASEQNYKRAIRKYEKTSQYFAKAADFYEKIPHEDRNSLMEKHIQDFNNLSVKTKQRAEELETIMGGPGLFKQLWRGPRVSIIISLTSIILSMLFLSPNITGNAVTDLTTQTSNIIAGILFIIGIIVFYLKKR